MSTNATTPERESVVAVLPDQPKTRDAELSLSRNVSTIEFEALACAIGSDGDYAAAAEFGRKVKQAASDVAEFFKPMKDAAYRAHKEVCEREKAMLLPLSRSEAAIKKAMGAYSQKKERERLAAEAEARRIAREEAERKLAAAAALEASGDVAAADSALTEALAADSISGCVYIPVAPPKADGVSAAKDWEVTSIDAAAVPVELNGFVLRPVDEKAVLRLIRASKGAARIPGVEYAEISKISIRK